ncbi:10631_t:CDS:1 [Paraglomus brasilianum]|uniref:10631_t:CDS:1 n=1 Tax=Paraglomus brasilianum TaxID=144538 RepID=A0A9N9AM51_9GLOM|nr:10631_t:CDS:1 [Paraglomus brasilianum]
MSEPNNMNNDYIEHYNNICQSTTFPEDFNFDDINPPSYMPVNLQPPSRIQDFLPSATSVFLSDNVDAMSMNSMDYGDTGTYTGDYASYQGNLSEYGNVDTRSGQQNPPPHDQVENSSCPLPGSFQKLCGPSVPHSDTTNDDPADNNFQHLNNTCISYIIIQMPTSHEYVVMREERTQSVLGKLSAASSISEILALTRM